MAMRRMRNEATIQFKPKKGFRVEIPQALLEDNTSLEKEKVISLWKRFQMAASSICEARYNFLTNKRYRRAVFITQMDKLCKDFSRRTENLKVIFQITPRIPQRSGKEDYQLRFLQLTDIPEASRNAPSCTAEIPPSEAQVFGEYVSDRYDTGLHVVVEQITPEGGTTVIPTAPIEFLDDRPAPTIYISESSMEYDNMNNYPLATTVVAVVEETPSTEEPLSVFATARLET